MDYQVQLAQKDGYLHVRVSGNNDPETVMRYLKDIHGVCLKHKCPNVLIEENLEGSRLGLVDVFGVVSASSKSVWPVVQRIAYVDVNQRQDFQNMKFAETVAVNRSVNVRVFRSVAEAEGWLAAALQAPPEIT